MFSFVVKTYGTWRSRYPGQKQGKSTAYFKITLVATLEIGFTSSSCMQKIICHKLFLGLQSRNINIFLKLMMSKFIALAPSTFFLRVVTATEDSKTIQVFCNIVILVRVWIACAYLAFLPLKNLTFRIFS